MLSSVSYVCLGMCAGMWVISGGIVLPPSIFLLTRDGGLGHESMA